MTRLEDASIDEWKKLYDANFFSALALVSREHCPVSVRQEHALTLYKTKVTIPHLRASKGRIVYLSSGAATGAYTAWGAYGTSKAALNSLARHVAVEEQDITALAVSPGRVDTDMQKELREKGTEMDKKDYAAFQSDFDEGRLVKPQDPAAVIARLAVEAGVHLSGTFYKWDSAELIEYRL